jgi:hypothetical protein
LKIVARNDVFSFDSIVVMNQRIVFFFNYFVLFVLFLLFVMTKLDEVDEIVVGSRSRRRSRFMMMMR